MLESAAEADDAVQEAWLRLNWHLSMALKERRIQGTTACVAFAFAIRDGLITEIDVIMDPLHLKKTEIESSRSSWPKL